MRCVVCGKPVKSKNDRKKIHDGCKKYSGQSMHHKSPFGKKRSGDLIKDILWGG